MAPLAVVAASATAAFCGLYALSRQPALKESTPSVCKPTHFRRWAKSAGLVAVVVVASVPLGMAVAFVVPDAMTGTIVARAGALPAHADVYDYNYSIERIAGRRRLVLDGEWKLHRSDSRLQLGSYQIDILSNEVIEQSSETWGG